MVPVSYSYRCLIVRWKTTLMTASGFTLVVAALIVMLAFVNGIQTVCASSGDPENVVVLSKGAGDEVLSQMDRNLVSQIENTNGVVQGVPFRSIASREAFIVVNRYSEDGKDYSTLQLRGITAEAFRVHREVQLIAGRPPRPGQSETVIGKAVQRDLGLTVGDSLDMGRKRWTISGVMQSGGSAFESELWCDLNEVASQFKREGVYSTVVLRTPSAEAAEVIVEQLSQSKRLNVEAVTEPKYYEKQAEGFKVLRSAAWVIAWFMGLGAIFGVMNTMFAAIGQRVKDIAVMRILGFRARDILISFLLEALLISFVGGALGTGLGYLTNGLTQQTGMGSHQVEFAFKVDGSTILLAATFSLIMGVMGGIIPAMSAMRVKPLETLR